MNTPHYFHRVGIAISVLFNVVWGGPSNQTFSARNWAWYRKRRPNAVKTIDWLSLVFMFVVNFFLTITRSRYRVDYRNHCLESWIYWRIRKDVIEDIKCKRLED